MDVWITKYALSKGIYELKDVERPIVRAPGMICNFHGEGRDWCKTRDAAIERANEMRMAKIASLKKQIKKLERLFE